MAAEVALRPDDDRGREILDMLEELADLEGRTEMRPTDVLGDGTRRYHLDATDADVNALDPELDEIDPKWRDHLTNLSRDN